MDYEKMNLPDNAIVEGVNATHIEEGLDELNSALTELNSNIGGFLSGRYQMDDYLTSDENSTNTASVRMKVVYAFHNNFLANYGGCDVVLTWNNTANGIHVVGSRHQATRGRYIAMPRLETTVYSVRITDSGITYISLSGTDTTWTP